MEKDKEAALTKTMEVDEKIATPRELLISRALSKKIHGITKDCKVLQGYSSFMDTIK